MINFSVVQYSIISVKNDSSRLYKGTSLELRFEKTNLSKFPTKLRYSMIKNRLSLPQSATQPFFVPSRNAPPHQFIYSGEGHCVMTLKTAMQQTKPPLYLYHLNCLCPAHFKALLKLATSVIFNPSSDRSFFYQVGGGGDWWDLRRGGAKNMA